MKKSLLIAGALAALALPAKAEPGDTFTVDFLNYTVMSDDDAWVYVSGFEGSPSKLDIPAKVEDEDGNEFTVVAINAGAFESATSLTEVTIPNTVTDIGMHAFSGCSKLRSVTLSESLSDLPYGMFYMCTSLQSITIPEKVTEIGDACFIMCSSLKSVDLPSNLISIGESAFNICTSLNSIELPSTVQKIGATAFGYCPFTEFTIPKDIEEIGDAPFTGNQFLQNIEVEEGCLSYTSIDGVLYDIDKTKIICYPIGRTDSEYTVPEGVTYIASFTFSESPWLEQITLPSTTKMIEYRAFGECPKLKAVYCAAVTPPDINGNIFLKCRDDLVLYVPEQSVMDYYYADICTSTSLPFVEGYDAPVPPEAPTAVYVDRKKATIEVGETLQLNAKIHTPEGVTVASVVWTSTNPEYATVDENGLVTAVAAGDAFIKVTVTDSNGDQVTDMCDVNITDNGGVETIEISDENAEVYTLQGVKINNRSELPAGIYIVRKAGKAQKIAVK